MPPHPKKNLHNIVKICIFVIAFLLLCYFRTKIIYYQTVAYTFDQGRDFLKTAEIIQAKRLTFIGPTTGITGLFHGAWWYYALFFPYLLFKGAPQGFYYGVLALHVISLLLFTLFMNRKIGFLPSLLFLLIVSVSPYFIRISIFAANNTLTPIAILCFIYSLYQFFLKKKDVYLFLIGMSLGFVLETELSFGIFLIPSFLLASVFFKDFRAVIKKVKSVLVFFLGLTMASVPRIFFEIKNHFLQTKTLIQFLHNPTSTNPQSFYGAMIDRLRFFQSYFLGIFYDYSKIVSYFFLITALISIFFFFKKYKNEEKRTVLFLTLLSVFIFALSLTSRNNFFWENYLEGLEYIFLFTIVLTVSILQKTKKTSFLFYTLTLVFVFFNFIQLKTVLMDKKEPPSIGLRADRETVKYLYAENGNNPFCLRIYTPPVIPYTYEYLFSYYSSIGYTKPNEGFINHTCWYIFDKESYQFRVEKWRKENIPGNAILKKKTIMKNETAVELWEES